MAATVWLRLLELNKNIRYTMSWVMSEVKKIKLLVEVGVRCFLKANINCRSAAGHEPWSPTSKSCYTPIHHPDLFTPESTWLNKGHRKLLRDVNCKVQSSLMMVILDIQLVFTAVPILTDLLIYYFFMFMCTVTSTAVKAKPPLQCPSLVRH